METKSTKKFTHLDFNVGDRVRYDGGGDEFNYVEFGVVEEIDAEENLLIVMSEPGSDITEDRYREWDPEFCTKK